MQNFTDSVPGKPLRRGLNTKGVAKYSDIGHVEGTASCTILLMSNRKSFPQNPMAPLRTLKGDP